MRIIAGSLRGRKLHPPINDITRPTSDRTRETIFNILAHSLQRTGETFENQRVLDLFAGTGALGLEALSRGAQHATFVEENPDALQTLRTNITTLELVSQSRVIRSNTLNLKMPPAEPYSLVFFDPPYGKNLILPTLKIIEQYGWLSHSAWIVCELGPKEEIQFPACYTLKNSRLFGHCQILILHYTKL